MSDLTCSIAGCESKHLARGWCVKHYTNWRRNGDPLAPRKKADRPKGIRFSQLVVGGTCRNGHVVTEESIKEKANGHRQCLLCTQDARATNMRLLCDAAGCTNNRRPTGRLCAKHSARSVRHGDPSTTKYHRTHEANPMDWDAIIGACVDEQGATVAGCGSARGTFMATELCGTKAITDTHTESATCWQSGSSLIRSPLITSVGSVVVSGHHICNC